MKKYFLFSASLIIFSLCSFFIGKENVSAEVIADVSVRNIEIVSKTDSTIETRFDLVNKGGALSGIKYGARLTQGVNTID